MDEIKACEICAKGLPHPPRPILSVSSGSRIVIIGQAPGSAVHASGVPWKDKSGDNLRSWLGVDMEEFYDVTNFAIMPMGFCYPGQGKSGDLPPRAECAPQWHERLLHCISNPQLTLLIGGYAQAYYLGNRTKKTLTETVYHFHDYLPRYFVLPHPSPRNNIWLAKNPWFKDQVIPRLRETVSQALQKD